MTRRTDAAQRREAHLDHARELLDTGIAELTSEHGWRHWLLGAANLHRYSFRNQLLLVQQTDGQVSHVGIFAAVPYCLDLIGGPYAETDEKVIKAFRPKSAARNN